MPQTYPAQQVPRSVSQGVRRRRRRGRPSQPPAWGARRKGVGIGDPNRRMIPPGGPQGAGRQLPSFGPLGQRTLPSGGPLGAGRTLPSGGPLGAGRTRASAPPPVTDLNRPPPLGYLGPPLGSAGTSGVPAPGGAGVPAPGALGPTGLPLDPTFEAGRRMLDDELAARLAAFGPGRAALLAQGQLGEARLGTNEGIDRGRMMEQLAERGALFGGVQRKDEGELSTDYLRQRQDLANMQAQGLADFSAQEGEARGGYQRGLMELLMDSANRSAMSEYTPTPQPGSAPRPRPRPRPRGPWVSPRALRRRRAGLPPIRRR
jgi:hypothetical protein